MPVASAALVPCGSTRPESGTVSKNVAGQKKSTDDTSFEELNASVASAAAQSATLGALAMGAQGLSIWRRKQPVAC